MNATFRAINAWIHQLSAVLKMSLGKAQTLPEQTATYHLWK
jgi:hypothetical protein